MEFTESKVKEIVEMGEVFSCRLQGKRANKARKLVKELIEGQYRFKKIHILC